MRTMKGKSEAFTLVVSNQSALIGIAIVTIAIFVGTILFSLIEGWDTFHSMYYVIITISTVGYGDVTPITEGGKILTMIYALIGVPLFIFAAGLIIEARIRGFVVQHLHHHQKQIDKLKKENKESDKAIDELSDEIDDTNEDVEEIVKVFSKAHEILKKDKNK